MNPYFFSLQLAIADDLLEALPWGEYLDFMERYANEENQ